MRRGSPAAAAVAGACLVLGVAPSLAGGPLLICDPAAGLPYAFAPGSVPVFTDLGRLGPLSGPEAGALVDGAMVSWSSVGSAAFSGAVVGSIGQDIDATNLTQVIGTLNGHGGIDVVYDADGAIFRDLLGAPPGVVGIAGPEAVDPTSCTIDEAWLLLNGAAVDAADVGGAAFGGVVTHELGHAVGLDHSQANGAVFFFDDPTGPEGCAPPYSGLPRAADVETMYPFISLTPGGVGVEMATVNLPDDRVALSNLYPAPGWPDGFAAVGGTVFDGDGATPLVGVNVILRDLSDPFGSAASALSGSRTRGLVGPDGDFLFAGLDPSASYVLQLDRIVAGGFAGVLGPLFEEELWNGVAESSDPVTDPACSWTPISPATPAATADLVINIPRDDGEPNDTFGGATSTSCFTVERRILYPQGDVDTFVLTLARESFLRLDVDTPPTGSILDPVLGLFADDFSLVAASDDGAGPGEQAGVDPFLQPLLESGTYFVKVAAFDDLDFDGVGAISFGAYDLAVDCPPRRPPPSPGDLLASTGSEGSLLDVDPSSGRGSFRAPQGAFGPVVGLTLMEGELLATTGGGNLILLDPETGQEVLLGTHGGGAINGLAAVGSTLYGVLFDGSGTTLVTVDKAGAGLRTVGSTGERLISGLIWHPFARTLFGVTGGGPSRLVRLDLLSGRATTVGLVGLEHLGGLALAPDGGLLAGVGPAAPIEAGSLVRLDPATGRATPIGPSGFSGLTALAGVPTGGVAPAEIPTSSRTALLVLVGLLLVAGPVALRIRGSA